MQNENSNFISQRSSRRGFLAATGMASAALLGSSMLGFGQSTARGAEKTKFQSGNKNFSVNDNDILNFALNLEYLEAEFYLRATTGSGLSSSDIGGVTGNTTKKNAVGSGGAVTGGSQVPFATPLIQQIAEEIAADELAHVQLLRGALGDQAVARPALNLDTAFTIAATAANVIPSGGTFNPFANEDDFLLGAFIFEDVGVTAYNGAAPYIHDSDYLGVAASVLGVEAYHASSVRTLLLQAGQSAINAANQISYARQTLDGSGDDDQGITQPDGTANVVPANSNALVFARTFQQVLDIVYLGGQASQYGFFPNKLNGVIQ